MSEMNILLSELMKGMDAEIVELKKGLSKVNSILSMMEQGCSSNSVEAMPVLVDVVRKNLKDSVGCRISKMEEYLVRGCLLVKEKEEVDKKPKYQRKPRAKKQVENVKQTDKKNKKQVETVIETPTENDNQVETPAEK